MSESTNCGPCCPITGCSIQKLLFSTIVAFLIIFGFEWAFHTICMMDDYIATAELWRDEAGMQELFHISLISQFMRAFAIAAILCMFFKTSAKGATGKGIRIGLILGLLSGGCAFGSYAYMPLPIDIPLKWLGGEIILNIIIGAVIGAMHQKCCSKKESA